MTAFSDWWFTSDDAVWIDEISMDDVGDIVKGVRKATLEWVLNHPDSPGDDVLQFVKEELQE